MTRVASSSGASGKAQQPAQVDHRQNHAVQIGETEKASRRERHVGEVRHPDDFADVAEPKSELPPARSKHNEIRRMTRVALGRSGSDRVAGIRRAASPVAAAFGPARWVRLAIAALDVFGERGDFFDRGRELFGATRLLLGGRRCLRRRASRFLGRRRNLLRAARAFLQRSENGVGAGEDLLVARRKLVHVLLHRRRLDSTSAFF